MATNSPARPGAVAGEEGLPPHSDNVDEELRRIQLALSAVFAAPSSPYCPNNQQQRQQWFQQRQLADRYLTSFQTSASAVSWMVCDRLLQEGDTMDGNGSSSSSNADAGILQQRRFFAAQTLHTKCRSDIHELPAASLPSLRDSLLQHLHRYSSSDAKSSTTTTTTSSSSALTTRLALCVSALAVQMDWTTILTDLLQQQQQQTSVLLPILRVLPEECASDRLLLRDEMLRFRMRDHLVQSAPFVFAFLHQLDHDTIVGRTTLEAFHTWIRYVPIHPSSLVESPLLQASVQALLTVQQQQQQQQHPGDNISNTTTIIDNAMNDRLEPATDVVVEVLRMYPSHIYGNEALVQLMIPLLSQLPLEQALHQHQQRNQQQHYHLVDNTSFEQDEDILRAYCRVVTEMGESYMSWILSNEYAQASQLVGWVLKCSGGISNTEIASITLHFWYRLVADLECVEPYDWRQELVDVYTPHLLNLIDVCVTSLMRYPADVSDLAEDRVDDLNRHRFYVSETVEDCCRLLGGHAVLQRLNQLFRKEVELFKSSSQQSHATTSWQGIESCLACTGAIHRFVPSDESDLLPLCFALLPQLPPGIRPLRFTASKMIGKFAYWLATNPHRSDLLQPLLPYLAQGLSIPECAPAAAIAIKELCECSNQEFAIAEPVLQLYQEITAHHHVSSRAGFCLELNDELQILEGVCRALARHIQDTRDVGTSFLTRLVQPIGNRLAAAVADPSASSPLRGIIPEIERMTVIVQFLTVPPPDALPQQQQHHPIVDLMSSSWALLETATNRFPHNNMLAEKICRLHKHALRSAGARAYAPVLDALMHQLVHSFERTRQSPYLYAASICIVEYAGDPAYTKRLFDMVEAMARTAFSFLRNLDEFTNHPDVVEEFFYLIGRVISHCPDPLITNPLLLSLFQCAVVGMRLDHHGANNGTLKFVETSISYGLSLREQNKPDCQAALERALSQEGQAIVKNLALALMGDLPCYSNKIPEILWKLNLLCPGLLAQWLASAFETTAALPERAKNDFMGALDTGLARDEFSLAARAFQSACQRERRFRKIPQQRCT